LSKPDYTSDFHAGMKVAAGAGEHDNATLIWCYLQTKLGFVAVLQFAIDDDQSHPVVP